MLIIVLGAVSLYLWNSIGFFIGALLFSQLKIKKSIKTSDNNDNKTSMNNTVTSKPKRNALKSYWADMKEGLRYILATPLARVQMGMIVINAGGATFTVMPAFADSLGGAGVYGILLMAQAFGSLLGAILAPYLKLERLPLGYILPERSVYRAAPGVSAYLPLGLGLSFWCTVWHGFPEGLRTLSSIRSFRRQYRERLGTVFAATSGLSGIAMPLGA